MDINLQVIFFQLYQNSKKNKPKITIDELFSHFCDVPTKIEIYTFCDSITLKSVSLSKIIEIKLV